MSGRPRGGRSRAQSNVIGVVLLLGLTVLGTGLIVAYGSSALDDSRQASEIGGAEQAMAQLDSRSAMVALGDSAVQSVPFGGTGGSYSVEPGAGSIEITHVDFSGTDDHVILPETSLGSVVYENGDATVAYQGGGVWREGEHGGTTMVSPPEFHYQGATLTLPIVRVSGSGSVAGSPTARITEVTRAEPVFPSSETYPAPDDTRSYENPLENGKMVVEIQSRYYEAWADYFRSRTAGTVTVDASTNPGTVTVDLISTGTTGTFGMPNDGSGVDIRGIAGGHSLNEYAITLQPDDTDSSDFSNLQWSMYAEEADRQFELHLRRQSGSGCDDMVVSATVYYSENDGSTYQGWYDDEAYTSECFDADGDGVQDEVRLVANFVDGDSADPGLTYQSLSSNQLAHFSLSGASQAPSPRFDEHEASVEWESKSYADGSVEHIDPLMKHYLALMGPGFELRVDDKNSDTVNEGVSSGTIYYPGSGEFVTYLHITENEVKVELT